MKKDNTSGIIVGLLCLLVGVGYLSKAFGVVPNFTIFFDGWWTLFIIIPCLLGLISKGNDDKVGYLIGIVIGLVLLLMAQDVISGDKFWALIVAGVFVAIGANLIFPRKHNDHRFHGERINDSNRFASRSTGTAFGENGEKVIVDEMGTSRQNTYTPGNGEKIVCSAIFAGRDIRVENSEFEGAELTGIFGGIDLNLKNAVITKNVTIEIKAVFGGVDILVPPDVRVVVDVTPIMGGVENGTHAPLGADENTPTVYIKGSCVFGCVEVK